MITYREFHNEMSLISEAFKSADISSCPVINSTGLNDSASIQQRVGTYISRIAEANPAFCSYEHLKGTLCVLVSICRQYGGISFSMFGPDEVEDDPEFIREWEQSFIPFTRMTPVMLLGAMCTPLIDDMSAWCNYQANLIACYCIARGINIAAILDSKFSHQIAYVSSIMKS